MAASAKKFDQDWNLEAETRPDGSIASAKIEQIAAAQLILIRDMMKTSARELQAIRSSLGWSGYLTRELRGLRRDIKEMTKAVRARKRCRRAHQFAPSGHGSRG